VETLSNLTRQDVATLLLLWHGDVK